VDSKPDTKKNNLRWAKGRGKGKEEKGRRYRGGGMSVLVHNQQPKREVKGGYPVFESQKKMFMIWGGE